MSKSFRKCQYPDPADRVLFYKKLNKEIDSLDSWFRNMTSSVSEKSITDFDLLRLMNNVIRAEDVDFLGVEIGALVKKCPDINSEMLFALLTLRGDISRADFKDVK